MHSDTVTCSIRSSISGSNSSIAPICVFAQLIVCSGSNSSSNNIYTASATRHHLRTIQTIVENVYVWLVGPRHPVSER